jgi:hypothetical protein
MTGGATFRMVSCSGASVANKRVFENSLCHNFSGEENRPWTQK